MMDKILLAYPVQPELKIASQQFRKRLTFKAGREGGTP